MSARGNQAEFGTDYQGAQGALGQFAGAGPRRRQGLPPWAKSPLDQPRSQDSVLIRDYLAGRSIADRRLEEKLMQVSAENRSLRREMEQLREQVELLQDSLDAIEIRDSARMEERIPWEEVKRRNNL